MYEPIRNSYKKQISLLEVMISIMILAVVTVSFLIVFQTVYLTNKQTKQLLIATNAIIEKANYLHSLSVPEAKALIDEANIYLATYPIPSGVPSPILDFITLTDTFKNDLHPLENRSFFTFEYFAKEDQNYPPTVLGKPNPKYPSPFRPLDMDLDGVAQDGIYLNGDPALDSLGQPILAKDAEDGVHDDIDIRNFRFLPVRLTIRWRSFFGKNSATLDSSPVSSPTDRENYQEIVITTLLAEEKLEQN